MSHEPQQLIPKSCDIFCAVVDNYGDIGVSWRLARQLANEHGIQVRLWVDDLVSFARLCSAVDATRDEQVCKLVQVRRWNKNFTAVEPAELVLETFACKLPQVYVESMAAYDNQSTLLEKMDARRQGIVERDSTRPYSDGDDAAANNADAFPARRKTVWLNLEYLSAEDWVEGAHRLPSPHPSLPLDKYFFFPGFTVQTGGLILERDLFARRDAFQQDQAQQQAFWQYVGAAQPLQGELNISLFSYENEAVSGLLQAWADGALPIACYVPEGRVLPQVAAFFGETEHTAGGKAWQRGNLRVQVLPFVEQERYDELLWACDINFVRGEDSCVRAQWAAKPFIWQIYPQHDGVHRQKLRALSRLYGQGLPDSVHQANEDLWLAWNGEGDIAAAWVGFVAARAALAAHAQEWAKKLGGNNLALSLLDFFSQVGRMRAFEI